MPEEQQTQSSQQVAPPVVASPKGVSWPKIILTVIVIVVITALIAGAYWYFVLGKSKGGVDTGPIKVSTPSAKKATPSATPSAKKDEIEKSTITQYVNGATFELDKSVGNLLVWSATDENVNISSETLLAKEKEVYGDKTLYCKANDYPLGRISVREESTPYPGFELIKKLDSGKYLFYQDDGLTSFCYKDREKLRSLQKEQINLIKAALKTAN